MTYNSICTNPFITNCSKAGHTLRSKKKATHIEEHKFYTKLRMFRTFRIQNYLKLSGALQDLNPIEVEEISAAKDNLSVTIFHLCNMNFQQDGSKHNYILY